MPSVVTGTKCWKRRYYRQAASEKEVPSTLVELCNIELFTWVNLFALVNAIGLSSVTKLLHFGAIDVKFSHKSVHCRLDEGGENYSFEEWGML